MTKRVPFKNRPGGEQIGWADVNEDGTVNIELFEDETVARQMLFDGTLEGFSIGERYTE